MSRKPGTLIRTAVQDTRDVAYSARVTRAEDRVRSLVPAVKGACQMPVVYGNDKFFLTPRAGWIGHGVPNKQWGFLTVKAQRDHYYRTRAFYERSFPSGATNAGHLIVSNRVHSADEWEAAVLADTDGTALPSFPRFVRASKKAIDAREFFDREVYLFTRMGERGAATGWRGAYRGLVEFFMGAGVQDDRGPSEDERDFWREQSASVDTTLRTSWLATDLLRRRQLEWIIKHRETPGLPTAEHASIDQVAYGAGDWRTTLAGATEVVPIGYADEKRVSAVKITAPTGVGTSYVAFLPVAFIPNQLRWDTNWLHHAASLPFPVDTDLRFEVIDPDRAEKDLSRAVERAENQEAEDAEAGLRPDDTITAQQEGLRDVRQRTRMQRQPIAYWQCVFSVYDTDPDVLVEKVRALIQHYKNVHFDLVCPPVDQRTLYYQSFPGSDMRTSAWVHYSDLGFLAAAQPWVTSTVGDGDIGTGLYQGRTFSMTGADNAGVPVFYDLMNIVDQEGRAPSEVVAAEPGKGKTVSRGLKPVWESALRATTQFVWDPKGDFLPLARYAAALQLDPVRVKVVNLHDSRQSVSLDAYALAEYNTDLGVDDRETVALNTLTRLCHEFTSNQTHGLGYSTLLRQAITIAMAEAAEAGAEPTMKATLAVLDRWANEDFEALSARDRRYLEGKGEQAHHLHQHLMGVARSPIGRLLFADPGVVGSVQITPGDLVIFVALNMQTTDPGHEPTPATLVGDVVSGLMVDFIRSLLYRLPDEVKKEITIDEYHTVKRSGRAEALTDWLKRMGRSKRCGLRLLSQNASDFDKSSVSAVWVGGTSDEEQAKASCELVGIEPTEANLLTILRLDKGQFLFRDGHGRIAPVEVTFWDHSALDRFKTDARTKATMLAEYEKAQAAAAVRAAAGPAPAVKPDPASIAK